MTERVLITGVGSGSTGEQVLKALRLGRRRYDITVTNVAHEQLVVAKDAEPVLLPPGDHPDYVRALAAAANRAKAHFIIPGSDRELLRIAGACDELARLTEAIPLVNNAATVRICADKRATSQALERSGYPMPRTLECGSIDAVAEAVTNGGLRYPVVVKPKCGGGGSANVYVAQDEPELRFFLNYVCHSGSAPILQEYVGDPENEYTVGVLNYPDGTLAGSVAMRRHLSSLLSTRLRIPNRTGRDELGSLLVVSSGFTQGEIDDFAQIRAAAEQIARGVGSTGPLNVQGRLVGTDFVPFEINPRFSGTSPMRAMAGFNEPEALIDWYLGAELALATGPVRPGSFVRGLVEYATFRPNDYKGVLTHAVAREPVTQPPAP